MEVQLALRIVSKQGYTVFVATTCTPDTIVERLLEAASDGDRELQVLLSDVMCEHAELTKTETEAFSKWGYGENHFRHMNVTPSFVKKIMDELGFKTTQTKIY